jgi:hypothetical protein
MRSMRRLLVLLLACVSPRLLPAQTPLHTLSGPQGGTIIYGTVDGANTPPAAMGVILSHLHQQYGDRPQVGRVFRVRGTDSDAVFFTLSPHNPGMKKVAGMLLTSNAAGHVEAALLTDETTRFGTSINPMLQTLFNNWHPGGKALATSAPAGNRSEPASGPVAQLRPYRLQDNSASMMLAEGWRVNPASGGGTILAQGPHGETVAMGFPYLAHNSNDPRTAQASAFGRSAAGRNTIYAKNLVAPYGADLGRTLVELNNQAMRNGSPSVAPLQISQEQPVRSNGARCAIVSGTSSDHGQPLQFEGSFCQSQLDPAGGGFMNLANLAFAPPEVANSERATLRAMLGSFQVNQAIVNAQAGALAAPVIEAIHQIGRDVDARIAATHQQEDEQRSAFERHNDVMDRTSQGFSNYILDKSVLLDTQTGGHATTWDTTAQTIVNSNPQRYEFVTTPNYWKGIDY